MTSEGLLFRRLIARLMAQRNPDLVAEIEVRVVRGCARPGCSCNRETSVRLVVDEVVVACYDREYVEELIGTLKLAVNTAWGKRES